MSDDVIERQSSPALLTVPYLFLFCSFKETKYTTVVAFRSLQQLVENTNEKALKNFNGLTFLVGRSHIIVEVSLSLIGQTSLGWTPLPTEELVVAQRRLPDNTRHQHETGDHPIPRSQQARGRTLAGIGNHEPYPAMLDIKQ